MCDRERESERESETERERVRERHRKMTKASFNKNIRFKKEIKM